MKYKIITSGQFRKDLKLAKKRGLDLNILKTVVDTIADGKKLEQKFKDHALTGDYEGFRECHIQPDWLLVYRITEQNIILILSRTGSHSDLF